LFLRKKYSCIYGYTGYAEEKLGQDKVISSFPLGGFKQYIFTAKGKPVLTRISQLQGLKVGGIFGDEEQVWFAAFKQAGIDYHLVEKIPQNVQKLMSDRIDAMVSFLPNAAEFLHLFSYPKGQPLLSEYDRMTCHDSELTRDYIRCISASLRQLKQNGTTREILGHFYLDGVFRLAGH